MKRILISGSSGFIGTYLLKNLEKLNFEIYTISSTKKNNNFFGNFLDEKFLNNVLKFVRPNIFVHLAWFTKPKKFYNDEVNIIWKDKTIKLIDSFFSQGGDKFIFSSSCSEYGFKTYKSKIREDFICKPDNYYGKSKNEVTNHLLKNYSSNSIVLRNFFVCGMNEPKEKIISQMVLNNIHKKKIFLEKPYNQIDFIDVRDVANIFTEFIQRKLNGVFNIGTSCNNSPYELAKKIINHFNFGEIIFDTKQNKTQQK